MPIGDTTGRKIHRFAPVVLPRYGQGALNVLARVAALDREGFVGSQSGIAIPAGVKSVVFRAHDKQHCRGGTELTVELGE